MQIQINTDHNISGNESASAEITDSLTLALHRFSVHITRVEVQLSDENGPKRGENDIRCVLEARIARRQPIAVTHDADTVARAVHGATASLVSVINVVQRPDGSGGRRRQ